MQIKVFVYVKIHLHENTAKSESKVRFGS